MIRIKIDDTASKDEINEQIRRGCVEADRDALEKTVAMLRAEVNALRQHIHAELDNNLDDICDDAACAALMAMEDDEE